ncbi:MAG: Protein AmpE [Candidatus Erwinia impunctatus]|nr:Protein AmpE [Culicoides impunctatus]
MTLFTLLLVLGWERLFKLGEHWQLEHYLIPLFRRCQRISWLSTLLLVMVSMAIVALMLFLLHGWLFGAVQLLFWIALGLLCVGAGSMRLHYHAFLKAASLQDADASQTMAEELTLIHRLAEDNAKHFSLIDLQNALLWINYRFYLAPLFWFVVGGSLGPVLLVGYAVLRAWQSWLARHYTPQVRANSGIDLLLHWIDWLPVRLVGLAYALLGHGEKALPAWFDSLANWRTSGYQVLTTLAQYSLSREPHTDSVETPRIAVALAKKVSMVLVVIVALLTIYGTLV